ncbi:MAG: methylcrotonoyl-CoA carboxylase, partial [Ignavibacteriales bacterium CG_4_9_14_3_um_filter_34_10]
MNIGSKLRENTKQNSIHHSSLFDKIEKLKAEIKLGGGEKAIANHHKKGKLTARERINLLIDKGSEFFELNIFAGYGMYPEYGGAPSGGVVLGVGKIHDRDFMIIANDATVKAGAWFPITAKKNLRAQEIAIENNLPLIYLVDSAGVFLPLQDEVFPDKEDFGRIFRNNAVISAMGIPQLAAIMGLCVAGGAYLPIMSDEAIIVQDEGSVFLAGPHLVKAAIGEETDNETLGGAKVQTNISGVTDYIARNDEEAIELIRNLSSKISLNPKANFNHIDPVEPKFPQEEILEILPMDLLAQYDMYELIARVVDNSEIDEYKAGYGKSIITAYARIDGWAVGIVANQRKIVRTESIKGPGEMQIGGVIYSDSSDKVTRFILNCNQKRIPLLFLQDVTGFMVGTKAEHGGIIKDGAKMVNAVANSVVPKITFIVGNSFGAGYYAMCGKAYDPRFIFALPNSKLAVMGAAQSASVLLDIKLKQLIKTGKEFSEADKEKLLYTIKESYEGKSSPIYAASKIWVDDVINPVEMRKTISKCIEICNNAPITKEFKLGVIQT